MNTSYKGDNIVEVTMEKVSQAVNLTVRYAFSLIEGTVLLLFVFLYVILSIPVFLVRLLVTQVIAPFFYSKLGKPVSSTSNAYATDLYYIQRPPRTAIVVDFILQGTMPLKEVIEILEKGLVNATDKAGTLLYPEFRQYVESFMGFLFWKWDLNFKLENHIITHKLEESDTDVDSEQFVCQLVEQQLNKLFPTKKSPWEVVLVHNFKVKGKKDPCTLVVFRFQHCMADGYSLLHALVKGLAGIPLDKLVTFPQHSHVAKKSASGKTPASELIIQAFQGISQVVQRFLHDVDYSISLIYRDKCPWIVPDAKKKWNQLYVRSDVIPLDKLKQIKNRFGVSLTGLVLSAISAGASHNLKSKAKGNPDCKEIQVLPTFSTIPLPGRPEGLVNHHAGVVFDIPVEVGWNPLNRLTECEKYLATAKKTLLVPLGIAVWHMLGYQLAALNAKVFMNPVVPAFLTNFPGPSFPITVGGRELLSTSFAVGGGSGVCGIGFMVFTFNGKLRVVLTAENAVMCREELQSMLDRIMEEFETLYEISLRKSI